MKLPMGSGAGCWTATTALVLSLVFAAAGLQPAIATCTITGNQTVSCDGVTYRAVDDECLHYVDLAAFNAARPGVPLPSLKKTVAQNYAAGDVIQPVLVELTDYVDTTLTDHGFTDANIVSTSPYPNRASRLMTISGKSFRVTGAPSNGFATCYYSYDVATGGIAGVPHLLMAESSNDKERYTSLLIHHPDDIVVEPGLPYAPPYSGEPTDDPWNVENLERTEQEWIFGPDVGLATYSGRDLPITNLPFNIPMLFHPKTTKVRVVVSSLGCNVSRQSTDGGAVSQMWVFKFIDPMSSRPPVLRLPASPAEQRRIGVYVTHPWYFYSHYGTPARLLPHRQQGLQRMVQHMKYCGLNYIVFNAINGADRSVKSWYSGSTYFNWNSAGDLLSELPPIAAAEGIQLVPLITSLVEPSSSGSLSFTSSSFQIDTSGNQVTTFGVPALDPLRPEVQQFTKNLLTEIATRVSASPAIRGLGIRVNGGIGTCYIANSENGIGARRSGYSVYDLQQFKNATGSAVPTSPPSSAYSYLVNNPSQWEAWINFRCQKTREFWLACRDLIRAYRPEWTFYVQCDLPSQSPGTNIEWRNGETPYNLLRHHGYDPNLFANDLGIVISRNMMVAADRFFVSSRWGPYYGTNYQDYYSFHFAPGLAELYRTASGKACEFYQNYWEETFNPYYEYGSPGDPAGFFRTSTPAAPGRAFFAPAIMSVRRQDPDTMTWLGWNRPTLGHEADLRKFAQAFRALPAVAPIALAGTVSPSSPNVVCRWHGDRLAIINDSATAQTITVHFNQPLPPGKELADVVTGRRLVTADQIDRQNFSLNAEAYSLNTLADLTTLPCPPPPPGTYLGDLDGDRDVDGVDMGIFLDCRTGPDAGELAPSCQAVDFDCDGDVDQTDFATMQRCHSGAGFPADPACRY